MKRAVCALVAIGTLAAGCGDEREEGPSSSSRAVDANDLVVCLSAAGLESRSSAGFVLAAGEGVEIDGDRVDIGPAADPDASVLVVAAEQAGDAEKLEAVLPDAQLVGRNVLVTPHSLAVTVGSKPAGDPVPEEIVDQVWDCVPD